MMANYNPKQYAAVRGYLYRNLKTEAIPLSDVVAFMQKRYPLISKDEVEYLVKALSGTRAPRQARAIQGE
jgi:hypothetical protein